MESITGLPFQTAQICFLEKLHNITKKTSLSFNRKLLMEPNVIHLTLYRAIITRFFKSAFHDAVILYALAINETIAEGGDIYDGYAVTRRMWNRTFRGKNLEPSKSHITEMLDYCY